MAHDAELAAEHEPEAIRERLAATRRHSYLGDAVLGGIDGCVTTFAVVAGTVGGGFSDAVALVLGLANLIADGFSMAVSNYQHAQSQREALLDTRRTEERHIAAVPEGEREEVRQLFAAKGFTGEALEEIVRVITQDRQLWVNTMLTEEHGLALEGPKPLRAALATFAAFLLVGALPLLPFLLPGLERSETFALSAGVTGLAFFGIGAAKGWVVGRPLLRAGVQTLLLGGAAAALAYLVGYWLRTTFGI